MRAEAARGEPDDVGVNRDLDDGLAGAVVQLAAADAKIPFTRKAVARFAEGGEPMQAAGAAALCLAWEHRANF